MYSESEDIRHKISAIILAGGKSSRFGSDKALVKIHNNSSIIHTIVKKLQTISDDLIIVTNDRRFTNLGVKMTSDIYLNSGPLAGLHAGLMAAKYGHALAVACDMPFLNVELLRYMVSQPLDYKALVPKIDDWVQPLHSIYSRQCIEAIENLLKTYRFRMYDFLDTIVVHYLFEDTIQTYDPHYLSFSNLNSPKMLKEAIDLASS